MLPVGDPLRAHLPTSARFSETTSGLEIDMPGHDLITYSKIPEASDRIQPRRIKDVLVIGQVSSGYCVTALGISLTNIGFPRVTPLGENLTFWVALGPMTDFLVSLKNTQVFGTIVTRF